MSQGSVLRVSIPFGLGLGMFGRAAPGAPVGLQKESPVSQVCVVLEKGISFKLGPVRLAVRFVLVICWFCVLDSRIKNTPLRASREH